MSDVKKPPVRKPAAVTSNEAKFYLDPKLRAAEAAQYDQMVSRRAEFLKRGRRAV